MAQKSDDRDLRQYREELGRMKAEDLMRQLCFQLERQRQATTRVAEALEKMGGGNMGNLLTKAVQAFAPRRS